MRMPLRTRLTLVFAALMVAVLAATGTAVYRGFAIQLDRAIDERVTSLARELAADLRDGETTVLEDFGEGDSEGYFAQVLDGGGRIGERHDTANEPLIAPADLARAVSAGIFDQDVQPLAEGEPKPARLGAQAAAGARTVIVGAFLDGRNEALRQLWLLLWLAGPALGAIASLIAWLLSGAALRPVEDLRRKAASMSETDLSKRLPVPATGDEIAALAATLNGLLARLEQAFERERRFVDDASHELRTPLAILKTELDLALRGARGREQLEAALVSAAEESDRLNRLAEDLLVLARADRGKLPLKREMVDAEALLRSAAARFAAKARERGVELEVSAPAGLSIDVDPPRMLQAIGNLIANALAHTPPGGRVAVAALAEKAHEVVLAVADSGEGFPPGFIGAAFDPFTRAGAGRSRRDGGAGLGLAIVKGVVEAHGGEVTAANRPGGGAVVTARMPQ